MAPPRKDPVRRFAESLRSVVDDVNIERASIQAFNAMPGPNQVLRPTLPLLHYWDTDSLYWPAVGFLAEQNRWHVSTWNDRVDRWAIRRSQDADDNMLVSALFSAGFLGRVQVTAAHRIEFLSIISQFVAQVGKSKVNYREALKEFTRSHGLDKVLNDVMNATARMDERDGVVQEGARNAISRLAAINQRDFAYIESLSGTWRTRLERLTAPDGLLGEDFPGPKMEDIRQSDTVDLFWTELRKIRRDTRREPQTAIDAAALASIAIMNDRSLRLRSGVIPRFHTSSASIWRLFRENADARRLFRATRTEDDEELTLAQTVLRDGYTYKLRAMFPALTSSIVLEEDAGGPTFDELETLSASLTGALQVGEDELSGVVAGQVLADGRQLSAVIAELESSAMTTIWLRYASSERINPSTPPLLERISSGLAAIHRLDSLEETRKMAYDLLDSNEHLLRTSLGEITLQMQVADCLKRHWREARDTVRFRNRVAIERWGVARAGVSTEEALSLRDTYLDNDIAGLRTDPSRAERIAAVLLGLDEFDLVRQLTEALGPEGTISASIDLMRRAAIIMNTVDSESVKEQYSSAQTAYEGLDASQKGRLALGYGYVLFQCWTRMGFAGMSAWGDSPPALVVEKWPTDPLGWAAESYRIVEDSLSGHRDNVELLRLNHLVFVGTVAGLREPLLDSYFDDLLRRVREDPVPRVFDTLGYRQYLVCLRAVPNETLTRRRAAWPMKMRQMAREAVELLSEAFRLAPQNQIIRIHLDRARSLQVNIESGRGLMHIVLDSSSSPEG